MIHKMFGTLFILLGLAGLALSISMVPHGGLTSGAGLLRSLCCVFLFPAGALLFRGHSDRAAWLAALHAIGWILLNTAEPFILNYDFSLALPGNVIPAILLAWVAWKRPGYPEAWTTTPTSAGSTGSSTTSTSTSTSH